MTASRKTLALYGGQPVRTSKLNYARPSINEDDIAAVCEVLRSGWLTTGPKVGEFEEAFANTVGARYAVAVSSGTAALHAAVHSLRLGPGDEVMLPTLTFAATANVVVMQGATPVFVDVVPSTLLIDVEAAREKLSKRTRAVISVDYAGQPCDYDALRQLCNERSIHLVADACHALGGAWNGQRVGTLADVSAFSLHPVKHIAAGEAGILTTEVPELAQAARVFRNHGITADHRQRDAQNAWFYEMVELGYNYRLSDIHCALGSSQLPRLGRFLERRREIASLYDEALGDIQHVRPLDVVPRANHAYHLYIVRVDPTVVDGGRDEVFRALHAEGIGVNVHYVPVHLHPYYRDQFGTGRGLCPVAEAAAAEILTLPLFPDMTDDDVGDVVVALRKVLGVLCAGKGA